MEATDAGIGLVVCITEGIPVQDMVKVKNYLQGKTPASSGQIARALLPQARQSGHYARLYLQARPYRGCL